MELKCQFMEQSRIIITIEVVVSSFRCIFYIGIITISLLRLQHVLKIELFYSLQRKDYKAMHAMDFQ